MAQFENLRLRGHKGLKEAIICDLAKVNVFCGPNSSGKTTALECINDAGHREVGLKVSCELVRQLENESFVGRHWADMALGEYYRAAIDEVLGGRDYIFHKDGSDFWDTINDLFHKKTGRGHLDFGGNFIESFKRQFKAPLPKVVMIPAKRRLDSAVTLSTSEKIEPTGKGVLNFLFGAKNKVASSALRKCFEKISAGFVNITGGYEFETLLRDNNEIELKFRSSLGSWLFADDCGLGFRDLLTILYFSIGSEFDVVLIEEPENHLHPEIQRRLMAFLRDHSEKQFFLSTHSSVFLNTQFADRVFCCRMTDSVMIENATSRASALTELGYSVADNLVSDVVVLCEGPKDKPVLEEFFSKLGLLEKKSIRIWPLGGDIMDQLDLGIFTQTSKVVALIDRDPGSRVIRKRFLEKCEQLKIKVHQLERYGIENYFSLRAIKHVLGSSITTTIAELDVQKKVSDQLGCDVKRNNGKIAREMNIAEIVGTDLANFLIEVDQTPL